MDGDGWCAALRWISPLVVRIPSHPNLSSKTIPHSSLAGHQYITMGKNHAWCSLVLEVIVHRWRWWWRNVDGKDGGLWQQTKVMAGDHRMQEEGGASEKNTSLRVGCVVGGEDDPCSLPRTWHASVVVYSSCHKPSLCSLLTGTQYITTLPWGKTGSCWYRLLNSHHPKTWISSLT